MNRKIAFLSLLTIVIAGFTISPTSDVVAQEVNWHYTAADCAFEVPSGYIADCGYHTVPQDRTQPTLYDVSLHTAYFHSLNPNPPDDPILYLVGGPGAALLWDIDAIFYHFEPYLQTHDVVVYDQRGTGFSTPALRCDAFESEVECARIIEQRGIDLEAYNTRENAADAATLRLALNIEEWNLVGVSYGSRLALVVAELYPDGVRSVILDSVAGPGLIDYPIPGDDYLEMIVADCEVNALCNAAYPELRSRLRTVIRQQPDGFLNNLLSISGNTAGAWDVPSLIYEAYSGDASTVLDYELGIDIFDLMNIAMNCNDIPSRFMFGDDQCRFVGIERGPFLTDDTYDFDIPTLVINGRYDSITPTVNAIAVAEQLPTAYAYEFPYLAHGVVRSEEPCARELATEFLLIPTLSPDASCINATFPRFTLPDATEIAS